MDAEYSTSGIFNASIAPASPGIRLTADGLQDKKVYVQHLMAQESLKIWELLESGAHIYLCG